MRARSLKPAFFKDDDLADQPFEGRLLYQGLWCMADREGKLKDRPRRIKAEIFPYDDVDCEALLGRLEQARFIVRYQVDGRHYILIPTFLRHQNPHRNETASCIPDPSTSYQGQKQDVPRTEVSTTKDSTARADSGLLTPDSGLLTPDSGLLTPDSGLLTAIPPGGACAPAPIENPQKANELVAWYVDYHAELGRTKPDKRRVGQVAKAVGEQMALGAKPHMLHAAVKRLVDEAKSPSLLGLLLQDIERNGGPPRSERERRLDELREKLDTYGEASTAAFAKQHGWLEEWREVSNVGVA